MSSERENEIRRDIDGMKDTEVVERLLGFVGRKMVAVLGGVKDTRTVERWTQGATPDNAARLRWSLLVTWMLAESEGDDGRFARNWWVSQKRGLGGLSPLEVLHDGPFEQAREPIMNHVRGYVAEGKR